MLRHGGLGDRRFFWQNLTVARSRFPRRTFPPSGSDWKRSIPFMSACLRLCGAPLPRPHVKRWRGFPRSFLPEHSSPRASFFANSMSAASGAERTPTPAANDASGFDVSTGRFERRDSVGCDVIGATARPLKAGSVTASVASSGSRRLLRLTTLG
jgi:hypothetical protein